VAAEMEALRVAEAEKFDKVLGMVNSCEKVRKLFPDGASAFTLAGLNSSIISKKGFKLHPCIEVQDGDKGNRSLHLLPARGNHCIPPLIVIPVVRLS
jgi:hypothetical protein